MTRSSRGQSMSFDAVAATFLFALLAVFGAIYAFSYFSNNVGASLTTEANSLSETIVHDVSAGGNGTGKVRVSPDELIALIDKTRGGYTTVRNDYGIASDFCVFIEDENGNLVNVIDQNGNVRTGAFGSRDVIFTNGTPGNEVRCGS